MMLRALLATVALAGLATSAQAQQPTCAPDGQIMLLQDFDKFDLSDFGWRKVLRQQGCEPAAAELIAKFVALRLPMLSREELRSLRGHEGLLWARIGEKDKALALLAQANDPADPNGPAALFITATIAFLKKDRTALEDARTALAGAPKPADYDAQAEEYTRATGVPAPAWPPDLDAVDALLKCFDRPYREALSDPACSQ